MEHLKDWTREDYYTYFLIYAANADFEIVEEEKEYILERVSKEEYQKIYRVFQKHNDIEKLEVFDYFLKNYCTKDRDKKQIMKEMQEVFWADGQYASLERIFMMYFKKMLADCSTNPIKEISK